MKIKKIINNHSYAVFVVLLISILFCTSCSSTTTIMRTRGGALLSAGEFDKAIEFFQAELVKKPSNTEIRTQLFRAKLKSYYLHLGLARNLRNAGKKTEAIAEYKYALQIFPFNKKLENEFSTYIGGKKVKEEVFKSTIVPPVSLTVDAKEKVSIKLPGAPIKKIFNILGKSFNVNFVFDKDFRDFVYSIEIEDIGFYELLNQLCMVSNTSYRILDSSSILIYQNTSFKKRTFDLRGVKVFYLSNTKAEETKKLLMTIFRDEQIQIQEDTNLNSLIVKGSSDTLIRIEKFIDNIDKEKSEVEIEIQILEVNRNIINAIGADYGTSLSSISAGVVGSEGTLSSNVNVNDIKNTNFFITIPSAALNFLESDDNTKIISKPNLRGVNGEEIHFMVGEERPVPQTSFQSVAAGGVSTVPMTTYTYKNVGVEIKITPFIHNNHEVTLKLKLTLNFVTGTIDQFPVLGKRELESVIRLKEGETNIVGGFIRDEVRGTLSGLPGFSKIPIIGKLFGNTAKEIKQTDLIFSITPTVIRRIDSRIQNQETIWTNDQSVPGGTSSGNNSNAKSPDEKRGNTKKEGRNSVDVSPPNRRVAANTFSYFTVRLNSSKPLKTINLSGSVRGPKATIEEIKADFIKGKNIKVFKNFSGDSFDLGYSGLGASTRNGVLAQLKIKFHEAGDYEISLDNIGAMSVDDKQISFESGISKVKVE